LLAGGTDDSVGAFVVIVRVTVAEAASVGGEKLHAAWAGKVPQARVTVPAGTDITEKVNVAELPALTVLLPWIREIETGGRIVVGSEAVLSVVLFSPPPDTTAMFVTEPGALFATLAVTVMAG
jgi:hypothetical protein